MFRKTILVATTIVLACAQSAAVTPKLIVVISLDQFRYDYIQRFRPYFGKGGFNYLLASGANFAAASFKHANNTTGPGHAAMLSGTYENVNGIVANDWFDRRSGTWVYCVSDTSASLVGGIGEGRSPHYFTGSTLGDELRLKTGFQAKVISLSNKDRAAILMGGRMPTGAFWMMDSLFVTSTYYMKELPAWVREFNASRYSDSFFGRSWEKKLPDSAYRMMDNDDVPYEKDLDGVGRTFPHLITGKDKVVRTPSYYSAVLRSPFGAEILRKLAESAITAEQLGRRGVTDMLCVSFSSPDYVGHAFGPHSQEVMDMAVRMDDILAGFFSFIDRTVGLKHCVIVLTADHGVGPIPEYILRHEPSADAGRIPESTIGQRCSDALTSVFGTPKPGMKWIDAVGSNNIYINRAAIESLRVPTIEWAASVIADSLRQLQGIAVAYSSAALMSLPATTPVEKKMRRSFQPVRSGDVVYALKPFWTEGNTPAGASHGEPYEYDAHVPVLLAGAGIRPGTYFSDASPIDIAPTLSARLGIEFPAGREGRVLTEALQQQ